MLNAKTVCIALSAGAKKNSSPSTLREFVALFCTKRRNKRRVLGWEVVGWQGVTDFEESAENYFVRILLPRGAGGLAAVRHGEEGPPPAALEALRHREKAEKDTTKSHGGTRGNMGGAVRPMRNR